MRVSWLLAALFLAACGTRQAPGTKAIVIGVDGMDPGFVERHWSALPNLDRLRRSGGFSRLATTTPPQSPVAWSTFITGLDPSQHGIFDFVHRNPATLEMVSSEGGIEEPRFQLPLGPYVLPLSRARIVSRRRGEAFWEILARRGVPVTILRMPMNYPPVPAGRALSGMGTPDLRGTLGTFSFHTPTPANGRAVLKIEGPPNTLRRDRAFSVVDLIVDVDPERPLARLSVGESVAVIRQGEWSEWLTADFPLIPHLASVRGMFRVFAKQLHPSLEIYVSPVNADPFAPALPISFPASFAPGIARETGRFYTMGTPQDTAALRQGVFSLPEFLSQTRLALEDERRLLRSGLKHFTDGLLFFYFSSVDQNSHMLWGKHERELLEIYGAVDAAIGEALAAHPGADLIVLSDHGFSTFDRAVNLNTWLFSEGFQALRDGRIDRQATRAYAMGLNALYLNQPDRALLAEIKQKLLDWRDPSNGKPVVEAVYETKPIPENAAAAPDLIVGYSPGYRASWETGRGETPRTILDDNTDAWIADHCINAADVPGVLFSSRPMHRSAAALADVTVSILSLFDVPPGAGMRGRTLY